MNLEPPQTSTAAPIILALSSSDITDPVKKELFEGRVGDTPPTEMEVSIKLSGVGLSIVGQNVQVAVYLTRYLLDCVWRDTDDPSQVIAPNAGTSVSKRIYATFFVGPSSNNIRLIQPVMQPTFQQEFDVILLRDPAFIIEKATNPYATVETDDITAYFENQFTAHTEVYGQPGLLLGYAKAQSLSALRGASLITVRMQTERPDFPSPFWYYKFLSGVSLWRSDLGRYDVVEQNTEIIRYFKTLDRLVVQERGGPYGPVTLYTLSNPVRNSICPFLNPSSAISRVTASDAYFYVASHQPQVTMTLTQTGLVGSTNLASLQADRVLLTAPSDASSFTVRTFNTGSGTSGTYTVASTSSTQGPARYTGLPFSFPNGAWKGAALTSRPTPLADLSSPFPWEQGLPAQVLGVMGGTAQYDAASMGSLVIPLHTFLFMDPGSGWAEDQGGTTTIGERSLQFDLSSEHSINRLQLLYPESAERHQPVRLGASMQRVYGQDAEEGVDVAAGQAVWFGGFQGRSPYGSQASPDTMTRGYAYINTHTQQNNSLYGATAPLFNLASGSTPSNVSWPDYVEQLPNDVTPAYDADRRRMGPFVRGTTVAELMDTSMLKGICVEGQVAEWAGRQFPQRHYFRNLVTFCSTTMGRTVFLQGRVLRLSGGVLVAATDVELMDPTMMKYIYPFSFTDTVPNDAALLASFSSLPEYFLSKYTIYLVQTQDVANPLVTDQPMTEYIVCESYYFAPYYDQYDLGTTITNPVRTVRPGINTRAQKMVVPVWSTGRYFGLTCGSFLSDTTHTGPSRFTRGSGNQVRLYAVRLGTQLFNFTAGGGRVIEEGSRVQATFTKTYRGGMLLTAAVAERGTRYSRDEYSTAEETVEDMSPGEPYSRPSFAWLNRAELPLPRSIAAANQSCQRQSLPLLEEDGGVRSSALTALMRDDTAFTDEYLYYAKASRKTPLKRSAEFHLLLAPSATVV